MHRSQASKQSTIRNGVLLSSDSRPAHCGIDTVNWIWLLKRFLTLFNETVLAIVRTLCTIVWFVSDCAARFHSGTRSLRFYLLLLALLSLLSSSTLIAAHSWALVHCAIHAELPCQPTALCWPHFPVALLLLIVFVILIHLHNTVTYLFGLFFGLPLA